LVADGTLKVEISRAYPLKDAAHAHRDIESRKISGSVVLIP
jgi:NADPH2:quinone reductase